MVGAVRCTVCPGAMSPVLKALLRAVKVWSTLSSFVTVILAPGATVKSSGWKAKFLMMMWIEDTGAEEAEEELAAGGEVVLLDELDVLEQAARARAPAQSSATMPIGRRPHRSRRAIVESRGRRGPRWWLAAS